MVYKKVYAKKDRVDTKGERERIKDQRKHILVTSLLGTLQESPQLSMKQSNAIDLVIPHTLNKERREEGANKIRTSCNNSAWGGGESRTKVIKNNVWFVGFHS